MSEQNKHNGLYAVIAAVCAVMLVVLCVAVWLFIVVRTNTEHTDEDVEHLVPKIVTTHEFDSSSFTQGLEMQDADTVLVGTGQRGESRLYKRTLDGAELASVDLEPEFFGEGVAQYGDDIWQLTWQEHTAIKRDAHTLKEITRVQYPGEGWGLCAQDGALIMSDGTAKLRVLDPETFTERDRVIVRLHGKKVRGLNELECVGDSVYANVFGSTEIVRINMTDNRRDSAGVVTAVIDVSNLPNRSAPNPENVLNGIAAVRDSAGDVVDNRFLLTGKRWPDLYEVELVPAQ